MYIKAEFISLINISHCWTYSIGVEKASTKKRHGYRIAGRPRSSYIEGVNKTDGALHPYYKYKLHCFCYSDLKEATRKFSSKNLIGQGGFGDVYKGYVSYCNMNSAAKPNEGLAVAIKMLRKTGTQGHEQWEVSLFTHNHLSLLISEMRSSYVM